MDMSVLAASEPSMFGLTMARTRVIMIALVAAAPAVCGAREGDAAFWRNEREIIELTQRLKLCEYRLASSAPENAGELDALNARLSQNETRLSKLQSEKVSLLSEVQWHETRNKEFARNSLEQKRSGAQGMKFETLTARDGRVFKNATITLVDDAGVEFRHEHGAARLRYAELTDERRLFFGLEESAALAAQDRERREALAYEQRIDMELEAIREIEESAAVVESPVSPPRKPASLLSATFPRLETGKLRQPARQVGSGSSYRRYRYYGYRSYRPVYRYVYTRPYYSAPSCPEYRTYGRSYGFSSSPCPSTPATP
jgi:hypothetical protein